MALLSHAFNIAVIRARVFCAQHWLDQRMQALTSLNASVLFLSCEPLLGSMDLSRWIEGANSGNHRQIDLVGKVVTMPVRCIRSG